MLCMIHLLKNFIPSILVISFSVYASDYTLPEKEALIDNFLSATCNDEDPDNFDRMFQAFEDAIRLEEATPYSALNTIQPNMQSAFDVIVRI